MYIHRLTDDGECTATYIHWLTDECTRLCSSIVAIFLGSFTEEYITFIFLGTEEYKITEEWTMFSCSGSYLDKNNILKPTFITLIEEGHKAFEAYRADFKELFLSRCEVTR
jgi:hypothetical protein